MEEIDYRAMTKIALTSELNKMLNNYMKIYDEYYSIGSRDSAFLKDLVDGIKGISAILEVYTKNSHINSDYAIEKLNYTKSQINTTIAYFERKGELENGKI